MNRTLRISSILFSTLALSFATVCQAATKQGPEDAVRPRVADGAIVTPKQMKAPGGYTFDSPEIGKISILKVTPTRAKLKSKQCNVDLNSLEQAIKKQNAQRRMVANRPIDVTLKLSVTTDGSLICVGAGEDCKVTIIVKSIALRKQ